MDMPTFHRDALEVTTTTPRHEMTDEQYDAYEAATNAAFHADWLSQFTNGFHVNTYEIDRAYGGPEEGGWWFDTGEVVKSTRCESEAQAERLVAIRKSEYRNTGDVGSVAYRGGEYRTVIEPDPGADYPTERPHFE